MMEQHEQYNDYGTSASWQMIHVPLVEAHSGSRDYKVRRLSRTHCESIGVVF